MTCYIEVNNVHMPCVTCPAQSHDSNSSTMLSKYLQILHTANTKTGQ